MSMNLRLETTGRWARPNPMSAAAWTGYASTDGTEVAALAPPVDAHPVPVERHGTTARCEFGTGLRARLAGRAG